MSTTIIAISIFIIFIIIWSIYSSKSMIKDIAVIFIPGEKQTTKHKNVKISVKSLGPETTILKNCEVGLTN